MNIANMAVSRRSRSAKGALMALTLDSSLARNVLGWRDRLAGHAGIAWTADWYRAFKAGADART